MRFLTFPVNIKTKMLRLLSQLLAAILSLALGIPAYAYAVGNRTQKVSTLPGYPGGLSNYNANDQLSTDTYDSDGNTTVSNGVGYAYDFENHLVQAGAGISFVYDGDGNRVSKTVAGVTTQYLVDTQNPTGYPQVVYESISGSTAPNREQSHTFSYGLELVNEGRSYVVNGQSANSVIYFDYDGHGSVRALTDNSGTVTDTYDYDAFGNLIHTTGTTPNNYLFAGEQFDSDLNLYYNRARYLNVSTGRFWSTDTLQGRDTQPLSLHKYIYASADPVDRVDPSGNDDMVELAASFGISSTINSFNSLQFSGALNLFAGHAGVDCHLHPCYVEENSAERVTQPDWRAPGTDETFVTYKVFYKFRGQTIRVDHAKIVLLEEFISGDNGSGACTNGCTNSPSENVDGIFVDEITAGTTGPTDLRQKFFVEKGQVKIFHIFEGVEIGGGYSQILHIYRKGRPGYKVED